MSCPICDRTMQNLGVEGKRIFWCSSCGSLLDESAGFVSIEMPAITKRVRLASKDKIKGEVAYHMPCGDVTHLKTSDWTGIAEATGADK